MSDGTVSSFADSPTGAVGSLLFSRMVDCTLRFVMFRRKVADMPGEHPRKPREVEI